MLSCVNGVLPDPLTLMGSAKAEGASNWGILDEHRNLIKAVEASTKEAACPDAATCTDPTHHHDHVHTHDSSPSHDHSHGHSHKHENSNGHSASASTQETSVCADNTCTDPSHNHDHVHHDHDHGHNHAHDTSCADTACTDPTHNHDHSHAHSHKSGDVTTAEERFGITSFVYKRRRPFHPVRFSVFLQSLGERSG